MTPEIIRLIEILIVSPNAARSFLYKEMAAAFIQNIIVVWVFSKFLIGSYIQIIECAPITSIWFTTQYFFNIVSLSYKVLFIPKLWKLKGSSKKKSELILQLRNSLYSEEYIRNIRLSKTIVMNYMVGGILAFIDLISSYIDEEDCQSDSQLRMGVRLVIGSFIVKFLFSLQNNHSLEQQKTEESLKEYIVDSKYLEDHQLCSICLILMDKKENVMVFQCPGKHQFHSVCIKQWIASASNVYKNCPHCKQKPENTD